LLILEGAMSTRTRSIAALLIAIALPAAACSDDDAATGSSAFTTAAVDEEAAAAKVLLAETEALITAIDSGDIETVMSMVRSSSEPERLRHGFFAAWDWADYRECEVITAIGFGRRVDCVMTLTNPVYRQFDSGDYVISFKFWDDGVTWQFSGGGAFDVMSSYREFFEANEPDLYAATCVPDASEQTVPTENGFALTIDCGALLHNKAADVAAWLDAGGTGE
jgi:hypothetical protein